MTTLRHFRTVLVANRGEIACRIIRTARSMGIETAVVFSDDDRDSPHVLLADRSVRLPAIPSAGRLTASWKWKVRICSSVSVRCAK